MIYLLEGTKKLFPNKDYETIINASIEAANEDNLPFGMTYSADVKDLKIQDLHDAMYEFSRDSGLDMRATFYLDNDCGQLQLLIIVDYPDEDNDTPIQ